jgi:K+-transporting ATPase A subunit
LNKSSVGLKNPLNQIPTVTKIVIKDAAVIAVVNQMEIQPKDPSLGHFYVSLVKSAVRIAAGISLIWPQSLMLAGICLILAEILGIVEEIV